MVRQSLVCGGIAVELIVNIAGMEMEFQTTRELFSPARADRGTLAMLSVADLCPGQRALDLGCGWGLVGVYAAKICGAENVVMTDIDPSAAEIAAENARRNGVPDLRIYVGDALDAVPHAAFDRILANPPYQADFQIARKWILKGFNRLAIGGRFYMVTKRREWYKNRLIAVFGGVRIHERDGYFVFEAERRGRQYAQI